MRCTTELTARFELTSHHFGSVEIEDALCARGWVYNEETDEMEFDRIEAYDPALAEALDTEELDAMEGGSGLNDALDFDNVPFESVEEELSLELFNQDAAEDRAYEAGSCECARCGLEENDEWELLTHLGGQWLCKKCMPKSFEEREAMRELGLKRKARAHAIRVERAKKFREALEIARTMRPDLNWAKYDYDSRCYA